MNASNLLEGYVSRPELAAALNVNTRTLSRYENQADGLPSVLIGGRKFYRLESVRRWLECREKYPNQRRGGRNGKAT